MSNGNLQVAVGVPRVAFAHEAHTRIPRAPLRWQRFSEGSNR